MLVDKMSVDIMTVNEIFVDELIIRRYVNIQDICSVESSIVGIAACL
jgi:hypothetical protein